MTATKTCLEQDGDTLRNLQTTKKDSAPQPNLRLFCDLKMIAIDDNPLHKSVTCYLK